MKKLLAFICFLLLVNTSYSQNYSNIISGTNENTADSVIFQHCIDSIEKYVYLDSRKIEPYFDVCKQMLEHGAELSNRHRFDYIMQTIYNEYNYNNTLGVLQIIESNREMLSWDDVLPVQKNGFKYLTGYTLLSMGEVESAQEIFYELLEIGTQKKDTSLLVQSLGALGKLFIAQNEFDDAEKYTLEFIKTIPDDLHLHKVNAYVDLIDLYIKSKQVGKAENYNNLSLHLVDSLDLKDLKVDFLLQKVTINLEKGKVDIALNTHKEALAAAKAIGNPIYEQECVLSYADILEYQNRHQEALELYDQFIKDSEMNDATQTELQSYYESASRVAHKSGSHEKAFRYITQANQIADSLFVKEQKDKSQYLRIKFDADQKEKENTLLNARILQEKSQKRFLYALVALFCLFTLFFFLAFLQKRKYNRLLESEVENRTKELVTTNKLLNTTNIELNDLTYSLSHDLKEPLLTVVKFSELAINELPKDNNAKKTHLAEYLNYIIKNGKRLQALIEDIAIFQSVEGPVYDKLISVDINKIIASVNTEINSHESGIIVSNHLPIIQSYETHVFLIFKNLIENGLKYNKSQTPNVHVSYEQKNGFHTFFFKDNGIGIDPQYHDRAFGMFRRLQNRKDYSGSGLGLNIVQKLCNKLGGKVEIVKSNTNEGSIFQVKLPIVNLKKI